MSDIPQVRQVMTSFPFSIGPEASVREAQELMLRHDIRHLPVIEHDRIVGVVSDRDVKLALDPLLGVPPMGKVRQIMVVDPYVVDLREPLDSVLLVMAERRIGCTIVARGDKLAGIFTATDACRMYGRELRAKRQPHGDDAA